MKRLIIFMIITAVLTANLGLKLSYGNQLKENDLYALGACLMDADSGRILYEKNGYEMLPNASTTKIMTCIIALEYGNLRDVVTISKYAASMPDVQLDAREGDEFYLEDLLCSLMLESHNDSAVAIAEHIAGSVEEFAELMNKKAYDIGCYDTYFITPNGLDATDNENGKVHSTTASDLARIMAYCIENPKFVEITNIRDYTFTNIAGDRSYSVNNKNAFLSMMDGVISGKTGFTNDAGYCYVAALERDGKKYTIALLGCGWPYNKNYKWQDSKTLFNYGINKFEKAFISNDDIQLPQILVENGYLEGSELKLDKELYINSYIKGEEYEVLKMEEEKINYELDFKNVIEAPVHKGEVVGKLIYKIDEEEIKEYNLYSDMEIKRIDFKVIAKAAFEIFFMN